MTYLSISVLLYFRPLEDDEGNEMVPVPLGDYEDGDYVIVDDDEDDDNEDGFAFFDED